MTTPQQRPEGGPVRVQRRRTRGWRMPPGAVYVGRPTRWGNPFTIAEHGATDAVARYRAMLLADPSLLAVARAELAARPLACWCRVDTPRHADVLLELANQPDPSVDPSSGGPSSGGPSSGGPSSGGPSSGGAA